MASGIGAGTDDKGGLEWGPDGVDSGECAVHTKLLEGKGEDSDGESAGLQSRHLRDACVEGASWVFGWAMGHYGGVGDVRSAAVKLASALV